VIFTKWWFVLVIDGPDEILTGFPFPYVCRGWHTFLSRQFFLTELILDLLIYFFFWFLIIFSLRSTLTKIILPKLLYIVLHTLAGLALLGAAASMVIGPGDIYYFKRPFDIEIMEIGYKFIWQNPERPDFNKYYPKKRL
jgi:hypothetical protein